MNSMEARSLPIPADLKDIPQPIIEFYGFDRTVIDVPLIKELAILRPECCLRSSSAIAPRMIG